MDLWLGEGAPDVKVVSWVVLRYLLQRHFFSIGRWLHQRGHGPGMFLLKLGRVLERGHYIFRGHVGHRRKWNSPPAHGEVQNRCFAQYADGRCLLGGKRLGKGRLVQLHKPRVTHINGRSRKGQLSHCNGMPEVDGLFAVGVTQIMGSVKDEQFWAITRCQHAQREINFLMRRAFERAAQVLHQLRAHGLKRQVSQPGRIQVKTAKMPLPVSCRRVQVVGEGRDR